MWLFLYFFSILKERVILHLASPNIFNLNEILNLEYNDGPVCVYPLVIESTDLCTFQWELFATIFTSWSRL